MPDTADTVTTVLITLALMTVMEPPHAISPSQVSGLRSQVWSLGDNNVNMECCFLYNGKCQNIVPLNIKIPQYKQRGFEIFYQS